jgi:hypothetical protein
VNGPKTSELSLGYFRLYVDVNVLLFSNMGGDARNAYTLDINLGQFHQAMDALIPIYRYGTDPEDDGSLLGCLSPRSGKNDSIQVFTFGQVDKDTRLREGMVDARYVMHLSE